MLRFCEFGRAGGGLDRVGIRKVAVSLISKLGCACLAGNPLEGALKGGKARIKLFYERGLEEQSIRGKFDVWQGLVMRFKVRGKASSALGTCKVGVGVGGNIHIKDT